MPGSEDSLRLFAERVLFSTTLDEKLAPPSAPLTDHDRGEVIAGAPLPGRPQGLAWRTRDSKDGSGRAKLPSTPSLVDDERRGELLHFFANHELLATELMALVLLKFPDAPAGFRQDVLATLLEEQNHTKWYLGRMQQCGVRLGDLPVSGFFWNVVAPMASPLDYVTRLSLTFEQANLDYALHYSAMMRDAGDSRTAGILDRIYQDEIGHVGAGLKWFRRWKSEGQSDWEAFQKHLIFPLSPSRAKANGAAFNAEGRLAAGLDEDFVRALASFERSKGRTPDVFWFCPDAERQMARDAGGRGYTANRAATELTSDLDLLPAFLARPDDVVLVRKKPSLDHLERLCGWGFELPEFEVLSETGELAGDSLSAKRKLHRLRPWAWCPSSAAVASGLDANAAVASPQWNEPLRSLFSKTAWCDWLGGPGKVVSTADQIPVAAEALNAATVVFKAPFAASGAGLKRWVVDADGLPPQLHRQAQAVIDEQGSLLIEPWQQRVFDFSVQYEVDEEGMKQVGLVRLHNRDSGTFVACSAGPKFCSGLDPDLARYLMTEALSAYRDNGELTRRIFERCRDAGYHGPLGIDAFIYRDASGALQTRSVCEVNPRYTMGRLALELSKRVAAGHWVRLAACQTPTHDPPMSEPQCDARGRLAKGCVVLTEGRNWQARLCVSRSAESDSSCEPS